MDVRVGWEGPTNCNCVDEIIVISQHVKEQDEARKNKNLGQCRTRTYTSPPPASLLPSMARRVQHHTQETGEFGALYH